MKFPGRSSEPRAGREPSPESGSFELVELTANDWQQLKELRLQALKDTPRAYGRTFAEEASQDEQEWRGKFATGRYFCAREGGKLVGMLCMVRERGEKVSHIMNVYSVYVSPEARRRGVATALLQRVLTEAADGATRKIRLRVDADSEGAKELYASMGFSEVGYLQDEIREGDEYVDEIIMEKFLG
jgi:ribosomal protein S18 acetylase RimI-like enzyme